MVKIARKVSKFSKKYFPIWLHNMLKKGFYFSLKYYYLAGKRPFHPAETTKARPRRLKNGFFEKYCTGKGLDIGCGGDPIMPDVTQWDFENGDAQYLKNAKNESFDYVNASHILEHMVDPKVALQNWWRVLKKGGNLIIYLPHRDLYERKKNLPSRWNEDHKFFFLPDSSDNEDTIDLKKLILDTLPDSEIISFNICDEGYFVKGKDLPSEGEFSIEVVVKKKNE